MVVSYIAPDINPDSTFRASPLLPAFDSLDMVKVIAGREPALWVYGRTRECDDTDRAGGFECRDFDPAGLPAKIRV